MYLVRKIIVGVEMPVTHPWDAANLEAPSRLAIRQAFQVARARGLPVQLVSVLAEPSAGWFGSEEKAQAEHLTAVTEATSVLQDLAGQYAGEGDSRISVECLVAAGKPWLELLRAANSQDDTMIVCGTRNIGSVSRALLGSTGLKLLRNACGPVWLVKPRLDDDDKLDILAASDLTEVGLDVISTALSVAQAVPSRLHVLHVVEGTVERYMRRTGVSAEQLEEMRTKSIEDATHAIHEQLGQTDYRTLQGGVQLHVATGDPDVCILNAIQSLNSNVLVMASQARGGVAGMVLGNTAEKLLSEIPCSLIVIKPDDFQCPISL